MQTAKKAKTVEELQFSEGISIESITSTSSGVVCGSSRPDLASPA